jgi:hypothetical protein
MGGSQRGGGTATAAVRNAMRTEVARSPAWTRGGKKRGACIARVVVGGGERGGKEKRAQARRPVPFEVEAGEGWGSGRGTTRHVEGKIRKRELGPGAVGAAQAAGGQRCYGSTVEGSAARLTRRERLTGGAGQHSAARFGFKPNQKHSKPFKWIQNSPNFD